MTDFTALEAHLQGIVEAAAEASANFLRDRLAGPGTGVQHPGLPNRSSTPDEYPAEQSGDLLESIDARPAGRLTEAVGAFDAPMHAFKLEFMDDGRPWASKAVHDPENHDAMNAAVEGIS